MFLQQHLQDPFQYLIFLKKIKIKNKPTSRNGSYVKYITRDFTQWTIRNITAIFRDEHYEIFEHITVQYVDVNQDRGMP